MVGFWQRGYFMPYVKVRISRGKLLLAKLVEVDRVKYHPAKIVGDNLEWGKEGKGKHVVFQVNRDFIYKEMNVECVNIDGKTNCFLPPDLSSKNLQLIKEIQKDNRITSTQAERIYSSMQSGIEGFSTEAVDSLVVSAKMKPSVLDEKMKIILFALIGVGVAIIVVGFFAYQANKGVNGLYVDIQFIKEGIKTLTATGKVIPTG
jgi:hypothetical protein